MSVRAICKGSNRVSIQSMTRKDTLKGGTRDIQYLLERTQYDIHKWHNSIKKIENRKCRFRLIKVDCHKCKQNDTYACNEFLLERVVMFIAISQINYSLFPNLFVCWPSYSSSHSKKNQSIVEKKLAKMQASPHLFIKM